MATHMVDVLSVDIFIELRKGGDVENMAAQVINFSALNEMALLKYKEQF